MCLFDALLDRALEGDPAGSGRNAAIRVGCLGAADRTTAVVNTGHWIDRPDPADGSWVFLTLSWHSFLILFAFKAIDRK